MASVQPHENGWRVFWRPDPSNPKKQRTKKFKLKRDAVAYANKMDREIAQGLHTDLKAATWVDFRKRYEEDVVSLLSPGTQVSYRSHLEHFERICRPQTMSDIDTAMLDKYKAKRRNEKGKRGNSKVSPATVNAELRSLRAAITKAKKWKLIRELPDFELLREVDRLPRVLLEEHFLAIYKATTIATFPHKVACTPTEWWRGFLTFIYCTGWRISEPLSVLRRDIDLDQGIAITRENKGKAEEVVQLADPVIRDLMPLMQGEWYPELFPWPNGSRTIYAEWHRIQDRAGIHLECTRPEKHDCNTECYHYTFHDIRRTFATRTGATLSRDELQTVMRHKAAQTTDGYINMRERLKGVDMRTKLNLPSGLENLEELADDVDRPKSETRVTHVLHRPRKAK